MGAGVASIEIAPGWVDAVQRYVEGLMVNSIAAAENAANVFHQSVVETARADEDWASMADNITLWSQDGHLVIGVQDPVFSSEASVLEYGDEEHPPHPILRNLTSATEDASRSMQDEMDSIYGPQMNVGAPKIVGINGH
jgi:hypothetical protein